MDVKSINLDKYPESSKFALWYWNTPIYKRIQKPLELFFYRVGVCFRWCRDVLWDKVYEFDSHGSFILLRYHLENIRRCIANGHHLDQGPELKQLRVAIKLLKRLENEFWYTDLLYKLMDRKGFKSRGYKQFRQNIYMQAFSECGKRCDAIKERDLKLFWLIFSKYYEGWWD